MKKEETKVIARNKKASHEYFILETYEAGIVLTGTEIKSIRNGKANLKDSYAAIKNGELYIYNLHISPYEFGNIYNKDPLRDRKLLVNKREIEDYNLTKYTNSDAHFEIAANVSSGEELTAKIIRNYHVNFTVMSTTPQKVILNFN
mgnify:CR=1 FL=1